MRLAVLSFDQTTSGICASDALLRHQLDLQTFASAQYVDINLATDPFPGEIAHQIIRARDRNPIERHDHIAGHEARLAR